MTNTTLCLHTASYPFGLGEQFIETEIKYLADAFEKVVIIPNNTEGEERLVPENVEVLKPDFSGYSTKKGIKNIGVWFFFNLTAVLKSNNKILTLSTLLRAGYQADVLFCFLKNNNLIDNTIHYTYWFNEQSTLLSILKSKKRINGFISRAHGFDLYEDRNKEGFIPFRKFQLKNVSKLFLISKNGLEYIKSKYPKYQNKYQLAYLGVEQKHPFVAKVNQSNSYTLVSCSRVVDIKRVHLIVEALAGIKDINIHWVHFGDGPQLKEIKKMANQLLPDNIVAVFKGHVSNEEIYNFYNEQIVDAFINVSSTEGLPVTIMEAISYGIPTVATDVGGTREIATPESGILLKDNPEVHEIKEALLSLFSWSKNPDKHKQVHELWKRYFNAHENYLSFSKAISDEDLI